ncbi:hypothetical protein, partial [Salmonella sp. s60131]|uniref:hypothetical protein n=1 Tax=Salmonella sp. s60131 TaxID=3159722 RepID=UPI0039805BC2
DSKASNSQGKDRMRIVATRSRPIYKIKEVEDASKVNSFDLPVQKINKLWIQNPWRVIQTRLVLLF